MIFFKPLINLLKEKTLKISKFGTYSLDKKNKELDAIQKQKKK